ncbi:hypothetical protein IAG25_39940 [Caballeronia sp. EK]|uniref:hypothetical protein n=1 Tax=Caballeronia sp. EK TaxID=2767469 RepID=UPI001655CAF3|nr:hypothetical protein [Caballeronia sp. EK]MBC8642939.1 hypothetical protein [Caballeronia sp. EK]
MSRVTGRTNTRTLDGIQDAEMHDVSKFSHMAKHEASYVDAINIKNLLLSMPTLRTFDFIKVDSIDKKGAAIDQALKDLWHEMAKNGPDQIQEVEAKIDDKRLVVTEFKNLISRDFDLKVSFDGEEVIIESMRMVDFWSSLNREVDHIEVFGVLDIELTGSDKARGSREIGDYNAAVELLKAEGAVCRDCESSYLKAGIDDKIWEMFEEDDASEELLALEELLKAHTAFALDGRLRLSPKFEAIFWNFHQECLKPDGNIWGALNS